MATVTGGGSVTLRAQTPLYLVLIPITGNNGNIN